MNSLFALVAVGCIFALIFTPLARAAALRVGLVDAPDQRRKVHRGPMPVAGGLAVLAAALGALGLLLLVSAPFRGHLEKHETGLFGLLAASLVICAVGLVDDFRTLRGRHKLLGQLVAVGIVMASGVMVERISLFGLQLDLGPLAWPFTALWLLGAINSLNLIDGMDGLLGSVGVIICLAMAVLAVFANQWAAAAVACALAGALLGFLWYNFPPASIFLGDCGSMLVGLVVGVVAIQSALKGPATVALAAPMALLTIPIFDTTAAILRRRLTGRSIYTTDRGHIHHCLLRGGYSTRRVLLLMAFLCIITVVGTLSSLVLQHELLALVAASSVVGILITGRLFGYAEFLLLKERLLQLWAARTGQAEGRTHQLTVRLQGSANWEMLWSHLIVRAGQFGLRGICLDVNAPASHEGYHARWDRLDGDGEPVAPWRAEFPLMVRQQHVGRFEVSGDRGNDTARTPIEGIGGWVEEIEQVVALLIPETPQPAAPAPEPQPEAPPLTTPVMAGLLAEPVSG
ncbi:MAG: undecaprenyl/decaprenyl-phosphate alpha-N-acetylglucosaminyl 1-phosphate transferase [Planctomycetia bacterium]|nr:undecaprenyl/decaprenyl-phosphate alpha-N-acetylglucosaminyl 1-phosphate transferase [Planctomycetia bacterium]